MKAIKRKYIYLTYLFFIIGIVFPLLIKSELDSWISVISLSFTILGTLATLATLVIAYFLYDKFGINAKFKENQVAAVFDLVDFLQKTTLSVSNNIWTYLLHRNRASLSYFNDFPDFEIDRSKTLLFPVNHLDLTHPIFSFKNNRWLPKEIKDKLAFLDLIGTMKVDDPFKSDYVRLNINNGESHEWSKTLPKLTFEMFVINLSELLNYIDSWLSEHSDIPVDLKI